MNFLSAAGKFTGNSETSRTAAADLARRIRELADWIEAKPEIVDSAADILGFQFITSRMPPDDELLPLNGPPLHVCRG